MSLGAVHNREQEMSEALEAPVAKSMEYVRDQDAAHMDAEARARHGGSEGGYRPRARSTRRRSSSSVSMPRCASTTRPSRSRK